jgi:hypothetical protein
MLLPVARTAKCLQILRTIVSAKAALANVIYLCFRDVQMFPATNTFTAIPQPDFESPLTPISLRQTGFWIL